MRRLAREALDILAWGVILLSFVSFWGLISLGMFGWAMVCVGAFLVAAKIHSGSGLSSE